MLDEFIIMASEGGGDSFNPLSTSIDTVFLTWVTFLVSLAILGKLCWKPLLTAVREREDRIANNIDSAEKSKTEAEEMLKRYEIQLEGAKQEVAKLVEEGRTSAEKLKKEIVDKAHEEAETARERAHKEIELARDQALDQIRTEAIDLSISVASRILERSLDDADHRKLAQDVLEEV